jgi:tetratricopeptide (TPR) repeat protein
MDNPPVHFSADNIKIIIKNININDFDNAITLYKFIIENHLKYFIKSKIYSNLAAFYLKKGDFTNALSNALTSITFDNQNAKAWGRIGWSFKKLKKYNYSLKAFEIANKIKAKKIYQLEIEFLKKKLNDNITIANIFSILKSDKFINKLKNSDITNNITIKNNNIINLINDIIDEL